MENSRYLVDLYLTPVKLNYTLEWSWFDTCIDVEMPTPLAWHKKDEYIITHLNIDFKNNFYCFIFE